MAFVMVSGVRCSLRRWHGRVICRRARDQSNPLRLIDRYCSTNAAGSFSQVTSSTVTRWLRSSSWAAARWAM